MKRLADEFARRFPELAGKIESEEQENPYAVMACIADWLASKRVEDITPTVAERFREFNEWCAKDGGEEATSALIVSLHEHLFRHENTRKMLPLLIPKEDVLYNAEYLKKWIGDDIYAKALASYE